VQVYQHKRFNSIHGLKSLTTEAFLTTEQGFIHHFVIIFVVKVCVMVGDLPIYLTSLRLNELLRQSAGYHQTDSAVAESVGSAFGYSQLGAQRFQNMAIDVCTV
jgi:hypothetical protein